MMPELNLQSFLLWVVGQLIIAAAVWGSIRADIKSIHHRIERVEKATDDAHGRIDRHFDGPEKRARAR